MQTLATWKEYESKALEMANIGGVEELTHCVFLNGIAQPGVIYWSERDLKLPEVYESIRKIESLFNSSFSGLEIVAVESPKGYNPEREFQRYSANLAAKENGQVCAEIILDFVYNSNHEGLPAIPSERFPPAPFNMIGLLSLGQYQQKTAAFLSGVWDSISSFHYFEREVKNFDSNFILEMNGQRPVSGGQHMLKKIGLSLPQKVVYLSP